MEKTVLTQVCNLQVGDKVRYRDVNLRFYIGIVVKMGNMPHGGNCVVHWSNGVTSEECRFNLCHVEK